MKIVILESKAVNPGDISWDAITSLGETQIWDNTTEEDKWAHIADAEVVLTNKVIIDEEVLTRFPSIRYVGVCATGYNVVDLAACRRHGVAVTNVPAYSTASVAQHTFALLLDLASKITLHDASVRKGEWIRSETFCYWRAPITELAGKTLGIFGYGNIGREVAKIANAFGMRVLVCTAHPEKYQGDASADLSFVDRDTFFAGSDVISFHCPLTEDTAHLVRSETIEKMRDGVILINVARGGIIKEHDLALALKSGKVQAAAVDVISTEPMSEDNPLIGAPNLIITPHIAWASIEARKRLVDTIAKNIACWQKGTPQNLVS